MQIHDDYITINMAQLIPNWVGTAGAALLAGLTYIIYINILAHPLILLLGGCALVLEYFLFNIYNTYAELYNQLKVLEIASFVKSQVLEKGTKLDLHSLIDKEKNNVD